MRKFAEFRIKDGLCRNNGLGDYFRFPYDDKTWAIVATDLGDDDYTLAILLHELIEAHLTQREGIPESVIDKYDADFEKRRAAGEVPNDAEPGDQLDCPYREQHKIATEFESLLLKRMNKLPEWYERHLDHVIDKLKK